MVVLALGDSKKNWPAIRFELCIPACLMHKSLTKEEIFGRGSKNLTFMTSFIDNPLLKKLNFSLKIKTIL